MRLAREGLQRALRNNCFNPQPRDAAGSAGLRFVLVGRCFNPQPRDAAGTTLPHFRSNYFAFQSTAARCGWKRVVSLPSMTWRFNPQPRDAAGRGVCVLGGKSACFNPQPRDAAGGHCRNRVQRGRCFNPQPRDAAGNDNQVARQCTAVSIHSRAMRLGPTLARSR